MEEKYILSLDIGTTTIRSVIYNTRTEIVGKAVDQVVLHYPKQGYVEIDPDELWKSVVDVVNAALHNAHLSAGQMTAMGVSAQRSTFITWSRASGEPFHRFITWKDLRADQLVKQWNSSYTWRLIQTCSYLLYVLSRSERFRAGSVLKFTNTQTTLRYCWALQNVPALKAAVQSNDAMFGTLDTWLLYKMTDGALHVTDASSASATGFFDPFTMRWASWALGLFGIPAASLPAVVDTAGAHFAAVAAHVWGHAVPIRACIADQTASMWGSCCFRAGDAKLTLGSGAFFDVHTGAAPRARLRGLYPVVGWRLGPELAFAAEGAGGDAAAVVGWAQRLGLFSDPQQSAAVAQSVPDSDGVYFVPAFSGLGPPYNDASAASGLVGVSARTRPAHVVRAVLEGLAFRTARLYACVRDECGADFGTVRLDGGVSNNDFVAQLVADLTGLRAERPREVEMSSLGVAHLVGLHLGVFASKEALAAMRRVGAVFEPRAHVRERYAPTLARWEDAVRRLRGWHAPPRS